MRALGRWEWLGLVLLAVALAVSLMFINEGTGGSAPAPAAPDPSPTRADVKDERLDDARQLPGQASWIFSFYNLNDAVPTVRDRAFGETLAFEWDGAPFPGYSDDAWSFEAEWGFEAPPGRYGVAIAFRGELTISVAGRSLLTLQSTDGEGMARAAFDHPGGSATLRIELTDRSGPASIRWRDLLESTMTVERS